MKGLVQKVPWLQLFVVTFILFLLATNRAAPTLSAYLTWAMGFIESAVKAGAEALQGAAQ